MTQLFISYSRVDTQFVGQLVQRLQESYPDFDIWYDKSYIGLLGGDDWWDEILNAIAASEIFVYVLSNESVESAFCQAEFKEAQRLQKRIITIQARDRTNLSEELRDIQYIDMKNGVDDVAALMRLNASVHKQLSLVKKNARPLWAGKTAKPKNTKEAEKTEREDTTTPMLVLALPRQADSPTKTGGNWVITASIGVFLLVLVVSWTIYSATQGNNPNPSLSPTTEVAQIASETLHPVDATLTAIMVRITVAGAETQAILGSTQTQLAETSLANQAIETNVAIETEVAIRLATQFTHTPSPTNTSTATLTPLEQEAMQRAEARVSSNAEWEAFYPEGFVHDFDDGVKMVLVPSGCFQMGSTDEQIAFARDIGAGDWVENEQPVHEICFNEPFWIDQTEVTQGDFERLEGEAANDSNFTGDNRPVENIIWFEARDFCQEKRGGRLPTEAEWEYVARGVDAWLFPWGNEFVAEYAVYEDNSGSQTAEVGSRRSGASWVGAHDMAGNVWEWLNTIYGIDTTGDYDFSDNGEMLFTYLYDANDGREQDSEDSTDVRVLRSGSWNSNSSNLRAANRSSYAPNYRENIIGFRCIRSYSSSES